MAEPCLCGATDCRHCHPYDWWHDPDTCDGTDDCECQDPSDDFGDPSDYGLDEAEFGITWGRRI